jgi:signal transduction histidine kinase
VGIIAALFVVARTFRGSPAPGWRGAGVLVSASLGAIILGAAGALATPRKTDGLQAASFALFLAGSVTIYWVQPGGAGLFGALVAVGFVARWLPVRQSVPPVAVTLVLIGAAAVADSVHHRASVVLLSEVGLIAVYGVALLMRRVGESNAQAERLLAELERARGAEVRAAALAERQRLAREMHDVLAHTLSALALQLESTRLLAHDRGVDPDVSRAIDQAHGLAASGLDEARRAISTARGDALPGPERVHSLAAAVAEQSGLPVTVDVSGEPRELPADARLAVYRTAQEALTNVRRHATPDRVEVRLDYQADAVALVVEDHGAATAAGVGVSLGDGREAPRGDGYGLTGMRERAELLGGTLVAEPTGDGFRVQLVLPA